MLNKFSEDEKQLLDHALKQKESTIAIFVKLVLGIGFTIFLISAQARFPRTDWFFLFLILMWFCILLGILLTWTLNRYTRLIKKLYSLLKGD